MPVKTIKPTNKARQANSIAQNNVIPELSNHQAHNLLITLESPSCSHFSRVYITEAGYYFSEGNDLHELVDLDPKMAAEALLLRQGKKQKRIQLPGKYIARKQVIKEYTRDEILECREEILDAFNAEKREMKAKLRAEKTDDEDNPVKAITEALQKLTESKR